MLFDFIRGNIDFLQFLIYLFSSLVVVFLILPIHEMAHGFVAYKLGDPTAKNLGRLTINPFAHIDYIGAALILVFGFGYAKPVPVNPFYFKRPKRDMALTALAGPVSNILVALVALILYRVFFKFTYGTALGSVILSFLSFFITTNIHLAVFNLIPIPPLDGSRIVAWLLPLKAEEIYYKAEKYGPFILLIILYFNGFTYIFKLANILQMYLYQILQVF